MQRTRREFLQDALTSTTAVGLASLWPLGARGAQQASMTQPALTTAPAAKKLKLLFLGGTGFLGPHTVRYAVARGHEMTLFNRGKSDPELFPDLETIHGDRYSDVSGLKDRKWDAVIDTFAYVPKVVTDALDLLKDNIRQYVLISTVSVYKQIATPGMDETAPLATIAPEAAEKIKTHREVGENYGAMKALCEQAAEKSMPGRVCTIRPGLIVGPRDPSDRFTYWPVRVQRGGEVLSPGSGRDYVQFIDARDLGQFVVHCIEQNTMGTFNADRPGKSIMMRELLETCVSVSKSNATLTWVPVDFLAEHKVEPWSDMPVWVSPDGEDAGMGQVSTARAMKAGLAIRSARDTVADTLAWFATLPEERRSKLRAGISAEREKEVLAAWHQKKG
jgi:2'-hydroxyisoflavone reductase